jgi:hypothetical protein
LSGIKIGYGRPTDLPSSFIYGRHDFIAQAEVRGVPPRFWSARLANRAAAVGCHMEADDGTGPPA